jgi:phage terminase large subunit
MEIAISLQPVQSLLDWLYENSKASWLGYGGSRGGAKSGAIRRIQVRRRMQYPGTAGQILRRVWDDVQKNHINKMWDDFPELRPLYRAGEHSIVFPNGSRLFFDASEGVADVERKAFGPEFMDISVDQAEQFTEKELKQLKTTCRWPSMEEYKCKFGLFFNPGGVGAGFLQRVFVPPYDYHERETKEDFAFVQAYVWDNVEWSRAALRKDILALPEWEAYRAYVQSPGGWNGLAPEEQAEIDAAATKLFYSWDGEKRYQYTITRSQYGQELNRLDATMRPGQLLGDFRRFAGQYFSNWQRDRHVVSLDGVKLEKWWPRWISIDWGYQHHTAVYWHIQVGSKTEDGKERPLTVTYREYVVNHLSERAVAEEIVARNQKDPIENVFGGHDLWEQDTSQNSKEAQMSAILTAAGLPAIKKAKISRVNGWRLLHTMLDESEWLISADCPKAIAAMPTAIYDEKKNNEDILDSKDEQADIRDSLRYGLYTQYGPGEMPWEQKLVAATNHLTDATNRAIRMQKLTSEREKALRHYGESNVRANARQRFQR